MKITDSILMSINFDPAGDPDGAVLVIGRKKKNEAVDIINAFEGKEAVDLYKKLVGDRKGSDD